MLSVDNNLAPEEFNILNIIQGLKIWSSYNDKMKLSKITPEFYEYVYALIQKEKTNADIVTMDKYVEALEIVNIIKTSKVGKDLFSKDTISQQYFEFNYKENYIFRGFIDLLVIDHDLKTITPVDLKTGIEPTLYFINSILKYKYYLQMYIYSEAVKKIKIDLDLLDYEILPFKFLYINKIEKIPVIYETTEKWLKWAKNGFKTKSGYVYKGVDELTDEIGWQFNNNEFKIPRQIKENDFNLFLNEEIINE